MLIAFLSPLKVFAYKASNCRIVGVSSLVCCGQCVWSTARNFGARPRGLEIACRVGARILLLGSFCLKKSNLQGCDSVIFGVGCVSSASRICALPVDKKGAQSERIDSRLF